MGENKAQLKFSLIFCMFPLASTRKKLWIRLGYIFRILLRSKKRANTLIEIIQKTLEVEG